VSETAPYSGLSLRGPTLNPSPLGRDLRRLKRRSFYSGLHSAAAEKGVAKIMEKINISD